MINKTLNGEKPKPKISLPFLDPPYKSNLNLVKKYFYLLNSLESWESREGDPNCIWPLNSPNTHSLWPGGKGTSTGRSSPLKDTFKIAQLLLER